LRSGVLQASGLKGVPCEHEKPKGGASQQLFPFQRTKHARAESGHEQRGQRESRSEKNEDRGIVQRIFDDDECRAPQQAAKGQREIGAEAFGHEFRGLGLDGRSVWFLRRRVTMLGRVDVAVIWHCEGVELGIG